MTRVELPARPTEQQGLSPEHAQKAIELYQNVGERAVALSAHKSYADRYDSYYTTSDGRIHKPSGTMSLGNAGVTVIKQHSFNKAKRAAKKHFKQHEGAYQEQAVKEASEDGVELNGWPQ
jgi:hypothetical protein